MHGYEKGFTVSEVEFNIKRFLISGPITAMNALARSSAPRLSWDDVIDMFITNKLQ